MTHLTEQRISLDDLLAEVAAPECGGTCVFLGTVRNGPAEVDLRDGVRAIEYSAYADMAEGELGRIAGEARARWPGVRVGVRHRVGQIPVGEASIAIAAAAPHRAASFDACRYVIEEVKRRLPIWKKELRLDGSEIWVDPSGHDAAPPAPPAPAPPAALGPRHA